MGDPPSDPVGHARTTRKHAGETTKKGFNAPGLGLLSVAATGVSAVAFFAGGGWLYVAHRQVREQEARSLDRHSDADAQPPAS